MPSGPRTDQEAELILLVEAGEVSLLSAAVSLGVVPALHRLALEAIAEVPVQQIPGVAVGI